MTFVFLSVMEVARAAIFAFASVVEPGHDRCLLLLWKAFVKPLFYFSQHYAQCKKKCNDRRDFRRILGLKREVVLTDFEGPESYSGGLKIRTGP